jgi:hypothetical protein
MAGYMARYVIEFGEAIARRTAHFLKDKMDQEPPIRRTGPLTGGAEEATRRLLAGFGFQTLDTWDGVLQLQPLFAGQGWR